MIVVSGGGCRREMKGNAAKRLVLGKLTADSGQQILSSIVYLLSSLSTNIFTPIGSYCSIIIAPLFNSVAAHLHSSLLTPNFFINSFLRIVSKSHSILDRRCYS